MNLIATKPGKQTLLPEWSPLERVLITWPRTSGDWGNGYSAVEQCFTELATALLNVTALTITAENRHVANKLEAQFPAASVFVAANNDIWVRDYGPLTAMSNGEQVVINAVFNGWGEKYPAQSDNAVTASLHNQGAFGNRPLINSNIVIEGGAIEVDGNGTLMTRTCCLPTRDANKPQHQLSKELAELLGLRQIAWLEHGELEGDDTDAHIDTLARFLPGNRIVYQGCDDETDSHYVGLQHMANELKAMRNADGQPYQLTALPWPQATHNDDGDRLPLGYANFLICNQQLLLPTYGIPQDATAITTLSAAAPDFTVTPVNCRALVEQYGSLHCATMQIPKLPDNS